MYGIRGSKQKERLYDSLVRIDKDNEHSIYNTDPYDSSIKNLKNGLLKNYREEAVKDALLMAGANAYYEHKKYRINEKNSYFPDFITNIYFKGRQVILEPHEVFDRNYVSKMDKFTREYPNFYLVFIVSSDKYRYLSKHITKELKRFSKIWIVKDFKNQKEGLEESTRQILEKINELRNRDFDYKAYLRKRDSSR